MSKPKPPRIKRSSFGTWYVHFTEGKRSQRQSLGTKDQKEAETRLAGWIEQRDLEEQLCADPTIAVILDTWYDQWVDGQMQSQVRYPSVIKNLKQYFGKMPVSTVLRKHSRDYADIRRKGIIGRCPASESTIRQEMTRLRAALRFMVERVEPKERRLDPKLVPYVEKPAPSPPRDKVLTRDELDSLYSYCMEDRNRQIKGSKERISREGRFCIIAMETAQRKSAIQELQWDQVDFTRMVIQFNPRGRNQTSKRRPALPISDRLMVLLKTAFEERTKDYVLDSKTDVHYGVKRIFADLGIEGASPHTFRHTWATHAIEDGISISKVAEFLGDSEETVKENYKHLQPDYLRDVINRVKPTAHSTLLPS